jgi:KDO2-lipid IV(A) lauroyltransferase
MPPSFASPEERPIPPLRKRLKNGLIYRAVFCFVHLIRILPRPVALALCQRLASCVHALAAGTRRRTLDNLNRAFGETHTPDQIRRMGRDVFRELGRNAVDAIRLPSITIRNIDTLVRAEGMEHLEAAFGMGRGVIAVSGHIGNFELLGAYLALRGYPVTVVAASLYDPRLDALLRQNRTQGGLQVIYRSRATLSVVRALRQGRVVGLLVDQDTRVPGVFVRFFGHPAHTPVGPAVLSGRVGAPVVPMAIRRLADDTHLITVEPALSAVNPDCETSIREAAQSYTNALERFIRQAPAQWVWMHDRWKTRPREVVS